jgi:pimeloyl-ACP methyl ester carboxylesterase
MALGDRMEMRLPQIAAPLWWSAANAIRIVPPAWAETVMCLLPQGRVVTLPQAGHTINYTDATRFVQVLRPFLPL